MARKADFECSAAELGAAVERYFADCEENARKPTMPGLCFALDISVNKFLKVLSGTASKRGGYCKVLEMAQLRIIDDIEQRTDSMSVSRAKQAVYTVSRDAPAAGGVTVKIELGGLKKGEEPFG